MVPIGLLPLSDGDALAPSLERLHQRRHPHIERLALHALPRLRGVTPPPLVGSRVYDRTSGMRAACFLSMSSPRVTIVNIGLKNSKFGLSGQIRQALQKANRIDVDLQVYTGWYPKGALERSYRRVGSRKIGSPDKKLKPVVPGND